MSETRNRANGSGAAAMTGKGGRGSTGGPVREDSFSTGIADLLRRLATLPAQLSLRERLLVGALGSLLVLAALLAAWRVLAAYPRDLAARVKSIQDNIAELRQLGPEALRTPALGSHTLAATLEELLTRTGMRDRVQLNPVTQEGAGRAQAMEVKAEQLTLDETVRLVYIMESPDAPIAIDQFEVAPSFRDKELLRVSLRVVGRG